MLFEEELKEGNKSVMDFIMDHTPESVNDSEEEKSNRVSRMLGYMRYLYPQCDKYHLQLDVATRHVFSSHLQLKLVLCGINTC